MVEIEGAPAELPGNVEEEQNQQQEQMEYKELQKQQLLDDYRQLCQSEGIQPHRAFVMYLEDTIDENDNLEVVIQGNDRLNFSNRLDDKQLAVLASVLDSYAVYIEDIDVRFNEITDAGAQALGNLIRKSPRLLGLNLQGNKVKSDGAQYLAQALKECSGLQYLNFNGNKIKTNGAMMVTELLFTHDKLLQLNLGNNKIDHDGVIGILSVLNCSNYTLEELNLDCPVYKTICQSVAIHFGKMFQSNVGL